MPIQLRCQCGKSLKAPDAAAGKTVKCPGCEKPLRVPSAAAKQVTGAAKPAAAPPPPRAAVTPASDDLSDLFDEEGLSNHVEAVCPSCRTAMPATAVLCTRCGYHKETGVKLEAHKTPGVDIDHGTLALQKASADLVKDREMQEKMLAGGGMPGWMLGLVLVIGGGAITLIVLSLKGTSEEGESSMPPLTVSLMLLAGSTLLITAAGCHVRIAVHAFRRSVAQGCLALLVPLYSFFHAWKNFADVGKVAIGFLLFAALGGWLVYDGYERYSQGPTEQRELKGAELMMQQNR